MTISHCEKVRTKKAGDTSDGGDAAIRKGGKFLGLIVTEVGFMLSGGSV